MSQRAPTLRAIVLALSMTALLPVAAAAEPPSGARGRPDARRDAVEEVAAGRAGEAPRPPSRQQQEEEPRQPPPPPDRIGGFTVSVFGGSQLAGRASGQFGAAAAYFLEPAARFGFEVEGALTLGPDGRVLHVNGNFVLQSGARTSRIVPYLTAGASFARAELDFSDATQAELDRLGIVVERTTETAPGVNLGAGVRYYLRDNLALRADFREFRLLREGEGGFTDRLFALRRFAGMISLDF